MDVIRKAVKKSPKPFGKSNQTSSNSKQHQSKLTVSERVGRSRSGLYLAFLIAELVLSHGKEKVGN